MQITAASAYTVNSTGLSNTAPAPSSSLTINDFFTLLCAQLQNQNMDNPVDDTQFISQMAEFTTLQQMQELSSNYRNTLAVSMIGKNVTVNHREGNLTKVICGTVSKVSFEDGTAYLYINNKKYELNEAVGVSSSKGD